MNKEDTKITLQDDKGNKYTLIKTERIDMQKELNKTITRLLNNWNELKESLREVFDYDKNVISEDYLQCAEETLELMKFLESRK